MVCKRIFVFAVAFVVLTAFVALGVPVVLCYRQGFGTLGGA